MKIGIAVTTFNKEGGTRHHVLDYTLSKLAKYKDDNQEIIVIDDSVDDGPLSTAEANRSICNKYGFDYFLNKERKGIPHSKKEGFERLRHCDYQIWLDDDCYPKFYGWAIPLVTAMDNEQRHLLYLKQWAHIRYVSNWTNGRVDISEYSGATACLMTFTKDIYEEIENFAEGFGLYGSWHHTLSTKIYNDGLNHVKYGTVPEIETIMGSFDITGIPKDFGGCFGPSLTVEERRESLKSYNDGESVIP